jgi:transposase
MEAAEATENLVVIWVDQGFSGENFSRVIQQLCAAKVDVICRSEVGFQVLPKRWIVERNERVVESISTFEQGLRAVTRDERIYDLHGHDSFNVETTSTVPSDRLVQLTSHFFRDSLLEAVSKEM